MISTESYNRDMYFISVLSHSNSPKVMEWLPDMSLPIKVSTEAISWLEELAPALRAFYRKLGRNISEKDLAIEIERRYGQEILEKVCIPHGLFQGACLLIAMEVARESTLPNTGDEASDKVLKAADEASDKVLNAADEASIKVKEAADVASKKVLAAAVTAASELLVTTNNKK